MTTLDGDYDTIDPSGVSLWPTALRYGGYAGIILIIIGLIMHLTGLTDYAAAASGEGAGTAGWISNILTYGVWIGAVVMAVKHHRDNELGGYISFGRGFGEGFATSLIMGLIGAIWTLLFFSFIAGDAIEIMREAAMDSLPEDQVDVAGGWVNTMTSPIAISIMMLVGTLVGGAILSLIVAAIMKKENPNT